MAKGTNCVFTEATAAACRAVISSDAVASQREKRRVIEALERLLQGESTTCDNDTRVGGEPTAVLTYPEATRMLGYKSARGIYKLVKKGLLDPVYGSIGRKRSHGVTRKSVERHLGMV